MLSRTFIGLAAIIVLATTSTSLLAQQKWLQDSQLTRAATTAAVSVEWQEAPLRDRLNELAKRQNIGIFLDRRVNGSQSVSISAINVTFEEFVWRLCEQLELGVCRIENVYYVGPKSTAGVLQHELRLINSSIAGSDATMRRKWLTKRTFSIAELAEPRNLIANACQSVDCEPTQLESIPHDLWRESSFPPSSTATMLTLLLAGFDKSFEADSNLKSLAIVDIPEREIVTRSYKYEGKTKPLVTEIANAYPDIDIDTSIKKTLTVSGPADDLLGIHRMVVHDQIAEVADLSQQLFTIQTAEKRGSILASIANQLQRKLVYTQDQTEKLSERIELDLANASVDQLIRETLKGSGFGYRITDDQLEIIDP